MMESSPAAHRAFWIIALLILGLAAYLRLQQITTQWLIDDEWHALHKIIQTQGYLPILTSFGTSDYSIPLTLYARMLADTIGLSELRMRFPMLLGGLAFVALAMVWTRHRLGATTAVGFGFLLAISPLLVNYSRNARPYMLTLLLAGLALCALAAWAKQGRTKHAVVYVGATSLASYMHLVMVPFLMLPLGWLWLRSLIPGSTGTVPTPAKAIRLGLITAVLTGAAVLPPLLNDLAAMTSKTGANLPAVETWLGAWHIWLGTSAGPIVLLGLAFAVLGMKPVLSAARLEVQFWLIGLAGILGAIYVMQPAWVQNPLTFGRYLLPALPLWLLLIAAGIHRATCRLPDAAGSPAVVGLCSVALIGTPHADLLRRPNDFTLHSYHQFDYRIDRSPVRELFARFSDPSPFWTRFREAEPGQFTIAVMGQPSFESYYNLQPLWQPLHRQRMVNLQLADACTADLPGEAFPAQGIHLRNAVSLALPGDLTLKGIDWVVVDRTLDAQMHRENGTIQTPAYLDACTQYLKDRFGAPAYADASLTAFRLDHQTDGP